MSGYETIRVERHERVAVVTLDRPQALNALNSQVLDELTAACAALDRDPGVGCIVLTGSERAFAAGADIKEMAPRSYAEMFADDYFAGWDALTRVRTPLIAAVAGHALGGGCELAMLCDSIIAADTARFGQPEVRLGVLPGIGGTQRLTRAVGKAKAMDLCLTGRTMDAEEAERSGLVARVVPAAELLDTALAMATTIASMSKPVTMMITEAIDRSYETTLAEGVRFERRVFHAAFATEDQKEGMAAFTEKRPPSFGHR
jgi:enoyl-CoA hydratase